MTTELAYIFDAIRIAPLAVLLLIAAQQDRKHGEVQNRIWLYTIIGLPLSIINYTLFYPELLTMAIPSALFSVALALILFYVGGWAGADGKALIMIGLSMPLTPAIFGIVTYTPIVVVWISFTLGVIYSLIKYWNRKPPAYYTELQRIKQAYPNQPMWKTRIQAQSKIEIRFMPAILLGFIVACLL